MTELSLEELRRRGILGELADVFDHRAAADRLLDRVDFPRRQRPGWSNPLAFWEAVCREIEKGLTAGLEDLAAAASDLYPKNRRFRSLRGAGEAGGAPEGPLDVPRTAPEREEPSKQKPAEPSSANRKRERLSRQLDELYERREELTLAGEDTRALDGEILDSRRRLRKGPQLQAGEFLLDGRFRLVEALGQGGFATVWKAYDRKLRRLVAVKVLHGQHSEDRSRRDRFFRGCRKMAELAHPHVVRVLEEELEDGGWLFFVMEYVAGGDFNQAVLGGGLTDADKLAIVSEVGEVLEFAHQRGLYHRDVKPPNVLLDDSVPKLTDFDLVRAEDSTGFTQTRAMLGTLHYAAPEALDAPKDAAAPADVYSLASTAVFALLGGPLPRGYYRDPGTAIAKLGCSPALAQVLARATRFEPAERYPSMRAFLDALAEATARPAAEAPSVDVHVPLAQPESFEELFRSFRTPGGERKELWCEIPAGKGWIGSPDGVGDDDERPRHQVRIVRPFWLGAVPVTNAQYATFDPDKAPRKWQGVPADELSSHPRVDVSWHEAVSFCRWLAERGFDGARMPTEEEWEYACRAGSQTAYWNGESESDLAEVGWYGEGLEEGRTHWVGGKKANPWGLYDVHGNVWEWTASPWDEEKYKKRPSEQPYAVDPAVEPADLAGPPGDDRVMRGGCFWFSADFARSAFRYVVVPASVFWYPGFRVLLPVAPSS